MGGNGHCAARLRAARRILEGHGAAPFTLIDVPYPGFEGRPPVSHWPGFLESVSCAVSAEAASGSPVIYGTGIGALLALCLRAEGCAKDIPFVLQGPVLWGLEHRLMPRVMRFPPTRSLLPRILESPWFQRAFARKYFVHPQAPEDSADFFTGYARCAALPDLFRWLNPSLLRYLETRFVQHPDRLADISIWLGDRDKVVGGDEISATESALNVTWPIRHIPSWGHYPMIDAPKDWIAEVAGSFEGRERASLHCS